MMTEAARMMIKAGDEALRGNAVVVIRDQIHGDMLIRPCSDQPIAPLRDSEIQQDARIAFLEAAFFDADQRMISDGRTIDALTERVAFLESALRCALKQADEALSIIAQRDAKDRRLYGPFPSARQRQERAVANLSAPILTDPRFGKG